MNKIEALIYCPPGDKVSFQADYSEADRIRRQIADWANKANGVVPITVVSLDRLPGVSWFYYLCYPILAMGGHLIKIEKPVIRPRLERK